MSAFAGILNFGNEPAPVDEYAFSRMATALDSHGPDGGGNLINNRLGMSYRAFHTNRESRLEVQPFTSSEGHMLTWNGRLDNRDELIPQLRDYLHRSVDITDLSILVAAYEKWRKNCFGKLIGDFSLALWDAHLRVLYLVRDMAGARALKYHINGTRIIWSTETTSLLNFLGSCELDEEFIASALALVHTRELTPFKNIVFTKPAHVVTVTANGQLSKEQFWELDANKRIRYRTDDEYREHGLAEFKEAIRCRLRSDRPVFAELSGGLDSSSIVCLADKLVAEGLSEAPNVDTVSHVFENSPTSNESKYLSLVEAQRGKIGHRINDDEHPLLTPLPDDVRIVTPNPIVLSHGFHSGVCAAMNRAGSRVLLSGTGGDQMFGGVYGAYPEVADHLHALRLFALHRSLRSWSRALKRPYVELLWKDALVRLLPEHLQARALRKPSRFPPWYNREFVKRMKLDGRSASTTVPRSFRRPSERDQAAGFLSVVNMVSSCWRNEQFGIDVTYPYLHRPLVEFLQAIPLDQLLRPGRNRVLMRSMMTGILPDEIRERRSKGNPGEAFFRAIARESNRLRSEFQNSRLCAQGYIDKTALIAAFDRARHGYEKYSAFLVQTISLEFWLRGFEQRVSQT